MAKSRVKKRPDGRYMMQIYLGMVDGKRKYKSVYGASVKEVENKAQEVRVSLGKGLDIAAERDTFAEWSEKYLVLKAGSVSAGHYKGLVSKATTINYYLGRLPITRIRTADVQQMILELGKCNPWTGAASAKKTLVDYRSICSQIFQLAIQNRLMDYNPAGAVVIPSNAPKEQRRALTKEEQGWILNTPHRAQKAAMLMMLSGLRRGELIPLTWPDIDLSAGTIRVNKAVEKIGNRFRVKPMTKTEAGMRVVSIPRLLVDFLKAQPKDGLLVCPGSDGNMMSDTGWKRMWDSYLTDLNLKYGTFHRHVTSKYDPHGVPMVVPHFTAHWLRHTFCSLLYMAGIDVVTAKEQMGHADIKTTLAIYTHLDAQYKKNTMEKLDAFLEETNASHMQVK